MSTRHPHQTFHKTAVAQLVAQLFVGGIMLGTAMSASAASCTWNPATGNWSTSSDWSCNAVPGAADGATISAKTVTINTAQSILQLNNSGGVNIDAASLTLVAGGLTNNLNGVINIANGAALNQFGQTIGLGIINTTGTGAVRAYSHGNNVLSGLTLNGLLDATSIANARERITSGMTLNGNVNIANGGIVSLEGPNNSIGGTGTFNLNDAGARLALEGTGTSTLGATIVVRGQGNIGQPLFAGGANALVNNGRISADVSGATLTITPGGGSGSFTNNSVLDARNGGILQLSNSINNAAGQITAQNASVVQQNGITITGGAINSSGTGVFRTVSSSANFLDNVTVNGVMDMTTIANSRERLINGATINGAINIANGGILSLDSSATASGNQTIGGTAVINLNDPGARLAIEGTGATTLGTGVTVRGQGNIGSPLNVGGTNVLTSNGLISADVGGGTLNVSAPGGSGSFINNGTLQAINGGTLLLSTNITANPSGQIIAGAGSSVVQNGITVNGAINASGTGVFTAISSAANFLDGVNFAGTLDLSSIANSRERIINGATLNGAINIGNGGFLSLDSSATSGGAQTIAGTAVINLNDANTRLSIEGNGSTTLGSGITVRGQGSIGVASLVGGTNVLTSNGLISADINGGTLNIAPPANSGSFINNGTLQAINGGTLLLSTNITANAGSQIVAGAGSAVVQNGVAINGVVNASGTGVFTATSNGLNVLNGINFTGALDLTSIVNSRERIINGATLNGAINVGNGGFLSLDSNATAGGNQALAGTAVINLNDSSARLSIEGNGNTTLGAGITVRGQGSVGVASIVGGTNILTNNGLISADVAGGTLNLAPPANSGRLVNNSTLQAVGGGRLLLSTNINNAAGLITALNGSTVEQNGVTISGGTIGSSGTGTLRAVSSGTNFLDNVMVNGVVDMTTIVNSRERINNGATINGAINIANGGILSLDSTATTGGAQTLVGTGVINLNDPGARLSIEGNGSTTLAAGLTVRGQGNIGTAAFAGGANTLFNNGTILADGGTLTITNPANSGTLAGSGSLQTSGGTLNLATTGASTQGRLVMGGAGSALNLNTQNLTITNDYTNAQSGTGNSFARRAGVSGTGQILAGGNAAQAITGTGVSNGNTANATLTIGNVRVGATTFNYQVANTGSTGPSLRGAIQTNVNGASLTDARLSGAGVTASNYNTGAPGSNTGNLGVTFTAAGAGALAPLSGQVLNLNSNFDNIADQKLNIVLGSTAAAYNAAVGNTTPSPVQVANQRIGGGNTAALTVANTAVAGAFSEDLNASFGASTGAASGSGSIAGRLAGTNNTGAGAMAVAVNTGSAGAKTGTVTVNYQTAGAVNGVSNGLGTASVGNQVITVNGNVFQSATGAIQTAALNFGTVQVGQSVSQNLTIRNTATGASGFVEDLNASFGSASGTGAGLISGSGSLNGILAGTNSTAGNGVMTVAVNTAAAGNVAGSIAVNYFTAGAVNGVSNGLGTAATGSEAYGVNGLIQTTANVINQANPVINNSAINLGNVRIGSASPSAFVSVTNQATIAPQAALNASISGNALITGSGSVNLLAPGATNSNSLQVGMDTSTAGARNGTATISFVSDASNVGNCAPNCQLNIASQNVSVAGGVYRLANAQNVTPSVTLAARVGDAAPSAIVSITNQSPDVFTEALKVQAGVAPSGFLVGSNPANIAAQGTGAVQVSLNTATASTSTGNLTLNHLSTGAGTTNAADVSVGSSIVALTGKIYTAAVGAVQSAVNFGIVHVGDAVAAQGVSVQNSAPVTALNDTLRASIGGAAGAFNTNNGVVAGLTAGGAANTTALTVGLSTVTAGTYNGTAFVGLNSQNPDMADLTLASQSVALNGTVNNYANAIFDKVHGAGTLSRVGNQFILDFGTVIQNSGPLSSIIDVDNAVLGPADFLNGSLALLDGNDFASTLLLAGFSGVAAGGTSGDALSFLFDSTALGSFQDAVSLSWFGNNASGYQDQSRLYTLLVRGNVVQQGNTVPEPGTLALLLIAAVGAALARRRRTVAHCFFEGT